MGCIQAMKTVAMNFSTIEWVNPIPSTISFSREKISCSFLVWKENQPYFLDTIIASTSPNPKLPPILSK